MEGGDVDTKHNDGSDTEVVYRQGESDDDTTKKSDSSPIVPTSLPLVMVNRIVLCQPSLTVNFDKTYSRRCHFYSQWCNFYSWS